MAAQVTAQQGQPLSHETRLEIQASFREARWSQQERQQRGIWNPARKRAIHSEPSPCPTRHSSIAKIVGREVQSEPIAISMAGHAFPLLVQPPLSSSASAPLFFPLSRSALPLLAQFLSFCNSAAAIQSDSLDNLPPSSNHIGADASRPARLSGVVLHHAIAQETTHKMLHWVLDLSVASRQVR